ncbi:acyl-CoA carboxylase epsilon subunit [Streptomyces sp. ITFR-16]|uniref:acyl-CoA carboxylase epsilon subunit n=1 Tax=Streptomyces sp. ITFR-16 TaxID=3075198 RepID=UPI00288C415C|nr:acyl-CoA carboxylase epsilon subunit [Streptomyces sp. ITFR-16]WNI23577.1 acyl-CoA carboxylase epsilon subunit [Streptomyces sp. ITFR-16]
MTEPPRLRIDRGAPTPTELAAVLLVLLAATRNQEPPAPSAPHRATWGPARAWRPPGTWPAP